MLCPKCNTVNPDDYNYCHKCGGKLNSGSNTKLGTEEPLTVPEPSVTFRPPYLKSKSKKPLIAIILLFVAALAVAGIIYFRLSGPIASITKAANNTLDSGSFNFEIEIINEKQTTYINGTVILDTEAETLNLFAKSEIKTDDYIYNISFFIKEGICVIDEDGYITTLNISDMLDHIFDEAEKNRSVTDATEIDWRSVFEHLRINTNRIDFSRFGGSVNRLIKNLNSEKYINEKLGGYKKTSDSNITYYFNFKTKNTADELALLFEDCINFNEDYTPKTLNDNIYEFLQNRFGHSGFSATFFVNDSYLSGLELDLEHVGIKISFGDFGRAKLGKPIIQKYTPYINYE